MLGSKNINVANAMKRDLGKVSVRDELASVMFDLCAGSIEELLQDYMPRETIWIDKIRHKYYIMLVSFLFQKGIE